MALPIEEYGLIGDCHTAALVGRDGSIDWLCMPRFDAPACFAALLGKPEHGRWQIRPRGEIVKTTRRYLPGTLVLETTFETAEGVVALVDFMPPRTKEPDIVRLVIGRRGKVPMRCEFILRPDYGSIVPWVRRSKTGITAVAGPDAFFLDADIELHGENMHTVGEFEVAPGEEKRFDFGWYRSHEQRHELVDADSLLRTTEEWWQRWSAQCQYTGPYQDLVLRSLITLKALTYLPTGGLVAAPTTSLPEQLGGPRNWDYRFCWLRDATFSLYSLLMAGYQEEAASWRQWLLRAVAGSPEQASIMYGLAGERRLTELELPWLPGYENSQPVRVGNGAWSQFQLDVYGEVCDTLHAARLLGLPIDKNVWAVERKLVQFVAENWNQPDEGIWEVRGPRRHFVHSKVMAWVALDRSIRCVEEMGLEGPVHDWRKVRTATHQEICAKGFDNKKNSFTQWFGSEELDASLLIMPLVGFLPPDDERILGTIAAVQRELLEDGFVMRYRTKEHIDGLPPGEGAFLPCSFWLADTLAITGRRDEAEALFERLIDLCNDLGLISEEYDVQRQRLVGNFPQAFTHVSLINTALNLWHAEAPARHRRHGRHG